MTMTGVRGHDSVSRLPPRIGIDIGGVLSQQKTTKAKSRDDTIEVPRAIKSVADIVRRFGPENVFIVSRCGIDTQAQLEAWLHQTVRICNAMGLLRANIRFCQNNSRQRNTGKGIALITLR